MLLSELCNIIPITIERDVNFDVLGLVSHSKPNLLTFVESEKYLPRPASNSNVAAILTTKDISQALPSSWGLAISQQPRKDFYTLHNYLAMHTDFYGKSHPSRISSKAIIHPSCYIAENDVVIGDDVIVEPHVTIFERVVIGKGSIIRSGARIGADGFEFKRFGEEILFIKHAGGVRLGENVEIQCNSNVDRSVFGGYTEIGDHTKIDTLVHIGHQSTIGKRCLIAAQSVVSGSTVIGNDVWIGPGSTISSELTIGNRAKITLGSVVTTNVAEEQHVTGNFAIDHGRYLAFIKSIR